MRKPNLRELRLLLIFGAMLFVIVNLVLVKWHSAARAKITGQILQQEQAVKEFQTLLAEGPYWETRHQWLLANPLEPHLGQKTDSGFAEQMQKSFTENGLVIDSQQMKDTTRQDRLTETVLEFTVKGRLEQIIRWLSQVQQPGRHVVIQSISLRRLDEGEAMVARIRISKIFGLAALPAS